MAEELSHFEILDAQESNSVDLEDHGADTMGELFPDHFALRFGSIQLYYALSFDFNFVLSKNPYNRKSSTFSSLPYFSSFDRQYIPAPGTDGGRYKTRNGCSKITQFLSDATHSKSLW